MCKVCSCETHLWAQRPTINLRCFSGETRLVPWHLRLDSEASFQLLSDGLHTLPPCQDLMWVLGIELRPWLVVAAYRLSHHTSHLSALLPDLLHPDRLAAPVKSQLFWLLMAIPCRHCHLGCAKYFSKPTSGLHFCFSYSTESWNKTPSTLTGHKQEWALSLWKSLTRGQKYGSAGKGGQPNGLSSVWVTHMVEEITNLKKLSSDLHQPLVA